MSNKKEGLIDAMKIISDLHDQYEEEHKSINANFLGRPTKRHTELLHYSRALMAAHTMIYEETKKMTVSNKGK